MDCLICHKPVVLTPTAQERANKFGGKASDYTKLFPVHATCQVIKRRRELTKMIATLKEHNKA